MVMPAAIETISGCADCTQSRNPSHTDFIICGLTARTMTFASRAASAFDACVAIAKSRASESRNSAFGSDASMFRADTPLRRSPPIRLRAMLPPPMKAIRDS